ncbi:MAG TPA: hypothetical protein VF492_10335 [Verrucomicrobiae bacterium]
MLNLLARRVSRRADLSRQNEMKAEARGKREMVGKVERGRRERVAVRQHLRLVLRPGRAHEEV